VGKIILIKEVTGNSVYLDLTEIKTGMYVLCAYSPDRKIVEMEKLIIR